MSGGLSKYIATFDYVEETVLVLSAANGSFSITLFATTIGALVGVINVSLGLMFSISTGIAKKTFESNEKKQKKKKHNKIVMLARSKVNNIENIISKALQFWPNIRQL